MTPTCPTPATQRGRVAEKHPAPRSGAADELITLRQGSSGFVRVRAHAPLRWPQGASVLPLEITFVRIYMPA